MKKNGREYFRLFFLIASCILFYFILEHFSQVFGWLGGIIKVLNPVLYGFIIAYLLNPVMELFLLLFCKMRKKEKPTKGIRVVALIFTYIFAGLVVTAIVAIIVPQAVDSVRELGNNITTYINSSVEWFRGLSEKWERWTGNTTFQRALEEVTPKLTQTVSELAGKITPRLEDVFSIIKSIGTVLGSLIFGVFLSIYMLFDKENLIARLKKVVYTLFRKSTATRIVLFGRDTNETVGNFISGKILDSFIIGLLSYVVFLIFKIPFAGLFAVIVGITNIIPMFGPIIGGVINGFLLLLIEPVKVIPFIIMIVVIQQLDGNVIGPKILGKATGLSGFWVMIALTVGGGLFGLWGMLLSVPFFTVLYRGFGKLVNTSLESSEMPSDTAYYTNFPPHEEATGANTAKNRSFSLRSFIKRKKHKKKKADEQPEIKEEPSKKDGETDPSVEKNEETVPEE